MRAYAQLIECAVDPVNLQIARPRHRKRVVKQLLEPRLADARMRCHLPRINGFVEMFVQKLQRALEPPPINRQFGVHR
jgi:hypothetical protein